MVDRSISRRQVCSVIWDKSLCAPASVYPAAKPVWICSYSAQKSFSLQEHHTWCRAPKGSPTFAQPIPQEQEGWCQIQTLSELEGELALGAFSDLHIKPQENISHKACDNSLSIYNTDKPSHQPKHIPDLAPNAMSLTCL